jgi:hypothetical protein
MKDDHGDLKGLDAIARLQIVHHLPVFFGLLLLRPDDEEIQNPDDYNHRDKA